MGMRNIEVLATLFLFSYAKLLKTIVTALSVTNIMVASADNITDPLQPHKVWVHDGNIDYFSSKHLPLFTVEVLFLFTLFRSYTLFLLCGQWLQYIPRMIRLASSGKVYRNKVVGLLELFYLSILAILATFLLVNDTFCAAITASISLSHCICW